MVKPEGKFKIQTVAEMTGVPASTLRTWEQRYGFPSPDRTASSYRMYSQQDIDQIARVRELCEEGLGPGDAMEQVLGEGSSEVVESVEPVSAASIGDASGLADALYQAIVAFDPPRVQGLVRTALLAGSHAEAFEGWIWPAWHMVRRRWLKGELGGHQQRLATELLGHAARDMVRLSQPPAPAPWAVLGCFDEEDDPGPALRAALALHGLGVRTAFLGPRTRASVIRDAARALSAQVVGLSVTETVAARRARDLVDDYAAAIGERRWFVTGPGVDSVAAMVEGMGGRVAPHAADVRRVLDDPR